jgi:hypothetical protein
MKVTMLTSLYGPEISVNAGDVHDCDSDEAVRLIEAGFAVPFAAPEIERTVKTIKEKR